MRALVLLVLLGITMAQTEFATYFDEADLAALEHLTELAQERDPAVSDIARELALTSERLTLEGRLAGALEVRAGVNLAGDPYGQAAPSYGVTVSLDVMQLLSGHEDTTTLERRLAAARSDVRVAVASAFVRYRVAWQQAEAAAQALETAETAFRATEARYEVGDVVLADRLRARSAVAEAATALLAANGEVVVALEALAALAGLTAGATQALIP